jgi:hypothetical protein
MKARVRVSVQWRVFVQENGFGMSILIGILCDQKIVDGNHRSWT